MPSVFRILLTLFALGMVSSSWVDEGAGCCSGPRSSAAGKIFGGSVANLNACKAKCMTFDNCGYIEYGWSASTFCYIWSTAQACTSMSSGSRDCGSSGNTGVHTYKYIADVPSGECADLAGFWVEEGKSPESATTVIQTGCDAVAITDKQQSSSGTVKGNTVSMFGQTGSYDDDKMYWSRGTVWVRNAQDCAAVCAPGSCADNTCNCGSADRSGLTCELEGICRYSPSFDWSLLPYDTATQDEYIRNMLRWDGEFAVPGRGVMDQSYLTCDHVMVTPEGSPGSVGTYTAASKESLHISMLALVVSKTKHAWHWIVDAHSEDNAVTKATDRLTGIIGAYEKLDQEMPGLGGFLPWCTVTKGGFWINGNTNINIPGLDNGQLAWSMLAAAEALKIGGFTDLASRYQAHIDLMKKNAPILFLNPTFGTVYMMSKVKNALAPPSTDNMVGSGQLGDPYEGELMIMFLDLMCYWPDPSQRDRMWGSTKRNNIAVQYTHEGLPNGPITVQRGWRFSAHELWKYIVLPYTDNELVAQVLANGERTRTWNSKLKKLPGLMGSCYNWKGTYVDRYGIVEVSMGYTEPPADEMMVTAYGAMALLIADRGMGLAWHKAMMSLPESQTVMGSIEASQAYGNHVAMKTSWDTKVTANLAALGGTLWLTRRVIQANSATQTRFESLLNDLYGSNFKNMQGLATPYAYPPGFTSFYEGVVTNADYKFPGYKIYTTENDALAACQAASDCLGIWQGIHNKPENWCMLKSGTRTWQKGVPGKSVLSVKKKSEATSSSQKPSLPDSYSWEDLGAGCCSGPRTTAAGKLYGGSQPSIDACQKKCQTYADCGEVEYGWNSGTSTWCFVWSSSQKCLSLDAENGACGSSGATGVHTYKLVAQQAESATVPESSDFVNCVTMEKVGSPLAGGSLYEVLNDTGSSVWMSPSSANEPQHEGVPEGDGFGTSWQLLLLPLTFFCLSFGCTIAAVMRFSPVKKQRLQSWAVPSNPMPAPLLYAYVPMYHASGVSVGPEEAVSGTDGI